MELLDRRISLWINSFYCEAGDWFWTLMSDKLVWVPLYAVIAFLIFRRLGWKRGAVAFISIVLTIVACDQTCNLFKISVGRLRPCNDAWMLENGLHAIEGVANWGSPYGFFSGHAANSLGLAVSSSRCLKWDEFHSYRGYSRFIAVWAALVAVSRVFVGKHFFGDVLVGALVGVAFGLLFSYFGDKVWKSFMKNTSRAAVE